ncbi:MAG: hypothetical protein ACOYMN_19750 [Roseimicrobium sp.]
MTTKCPFHSSTAAPPPALDLSNLPPRIAALQQRRGFPVPWFVEIVEDDYDFRVMSATKLVRAVRQDLCWVCGQRLGRHRAFVIGPMCGVNRTNAEPPSHVDCAQFAAQYCPFLSIAHMKRREDAMTEAAAENVAGLGLRRNPGVCAVWVVSAPGYRIFADHQNRPLFEIAQPERVLWYAEGRAASLDEVLESVRTGEPLLRAACEKEATEDRRLEAHQELTRRLDAFTLYLGLQP